MCRYLLFIFWVCLGGLMLGCSDTEGDVDAGMDGAVHPDADSDRNGDSAGDSDGDGDGERERIQAAASERSTLRDQKRSTYQQNAATTSTPRPSIVDVNEMKNPKAVTLGENWPA